MLQGILLKKVIDKVLNKVMQNSDLKNISKHLKLFNELKSRIEVLEKNSHPKKDFVCLDCGCKAKPKK
jgi:hypothetical protein